MYVPKCYYLQHFEACMCQNAIIYSTSEPHDADLLLFARHSIRLFVVPSQYGHRLRPRSMATAFGRGLRPPPSATACGRGLQPQPTAPAPGRGLITAAAYWLGTGKDEWNA